MVARVKRASIISTCLDVELLHKRFRHASIEDIIITALHSGAITGYDVDAMRENGKYQLQNGICTTRVKQRFKIESRYTLQESPATVTQTMNPCQQCRQQNAVH
jgi:hypothetical protein